MAKRLDDLELSDFDDAPMWSSGAEHCDEEVVGPLIGRDSLRNGESNMWVRFQGSLADQTPVGDCHGGVTAANSSRLVVLRGR